MILHIIKVMYTPKLQFNNQYLWYLKTEANNFLVLRLIIKSFLLQHKLHSRRVEQMQL